MRVLTETELRLVSGGRGDEDETIVVQGSALPPRFSGIDIMRLTGGGGGGSRNSGGISISIDGTDIGGLFSWMSENRNDMIADRLAGMTDPGSIHNSTQNGLVTQTFQPAGSTYVVQAIRAQGVGGSLGPVQVLRIFMANGRVVQMDDSGRWVVVH